MPNELEAICSLMRECGEVIRGADRENIRVDAKSGPADFVTDYDKKVQDMLQRGLAGIVPDAHFVGEEGSTRSFSSKGKFFIVDPIDGTTNFIKNLHASAISVALSVDGIVELGVIYNPYLDELFTARRGSGAFCNGRPIHVSSEPLENGIVIFGTSPYNEEVSEKSFRLAYEYNRRALDVRRTGSAAIDLCNIAAGRAELFFELILSPWDYAAGALIVEEAGGIVTDVDGHALSLERKCSVVARNAVVQPL
jgi:myo-inositol-1(or 4)-monophosphatase